MVRNRSVRTPRPDHSVKGVSWIFTSKVPNMPMTPAVCLVKVGHNMSNVVSVNSFFRSISRASGNNEVGGNIGEVKSRMGRFIGLLRSGYQGLDQMHCGKNGCKMR